MDTLFTQTMRVSFHCRFTKDKDYFLKTCPSAEEAKRQYNDYVEMVETYIANLVTGKNVEATEKAISDYEHENMHLIAQHAPSSQPNRVEASGQTNQQTQNRKRSRADGADMPEKKSKHDFAESGGQGATLRDVGHPPVPHIQEPQPRKQNGQKKKKQDVYKQRIAGGFDASLCINKQIEEAVTTLFL